MVKFECGSCNFKKDVDDKYAGKNVRCPKCGSPVTVSNQKIQQTSQPNNLLKIYCPLCNKKIGVSPEYAGKRVRCVNCKNPLTVPADPTPPAIPQPVFDNVQSLADMEKHAKSVELPPELRPLTVQNEIQNQTDPGERIGLKVKKTKDKNFEADFPFGALIGMTIIIIIAGFVINAKIGTVKKKLPAPKQNVQLAKDFAGIFIDIMAKGDINEISPMLTKELQQREPNAVLKPLIENFKSKWNPNYRLTISMSTHEPQGNFFMFSHNLQTSEEVSVVTIISQTQQEFEIIGINFYDGSDLPTRFESSKSAQVIPELEDSFAYKVIIKLKKSMIVLLVLFAASRLSKAVIFYRADESPWAALIPVYHEWTLAETGDKSGLWAIAACVLSGVPFVYLGFLFYASIGIAESHGRGILFGIGLCLLPFIFYPILIFSQN